MEVSCDKSRAPSLMLHVHPHRSKTLEEGIEDFDIDDLLLMDNPIVKMELDV